MEDLFGAIILSQLLIFTHLFMVFIQMISGKNYFYGVYVKNIDLCEADKKRIDKKYKKSMNYTFFIIFILNILSIKLFLGYEVDILSTSLILYLILSYFYLKNSFNETKKLKNQIIISSNGDVKAESIKKEKTTISIDTKFVNEKIKLKNKFKILFTFCMIISIISFIYVAINYKNLPEQVPVHWGITGKPDSFAPKTFKNVFIINILQVAMVTMISYIGVETIGYRSYIDTKNEENIRLKALKLLNKMGYSLLLLTLSILVTMIAPSIAMINNITIPISIIVLSILAPIVSCIFLTYCIIMLSNLKTKSKSTYIIESDDEKWLYGFIYYNKEDPSFLVEKRFGAGWTFNMANKKSKLILSICITAFILSITITS
ncbi:MAG: DUF1648 domain-containing protein [Romboutsia sp.]